MAVHQAAGKTAYYGGAAAEQIVARAYTDRGCEVVRRRWRCSGGEIDLIVREANTVVFVEVKKARSFAHAAERLDRRQMDRICASAAQFLAQEPDGQMADARFDVALVEQTGCVQILENAFSLN